MHLFDACVTCGRPHGGDWNPGHPFKPHPDAPKPISQDDAKSYMRCFYDSCRRLGYIGEALGCSEDADPEDILAAAKAHADFVRRIVAYVERGDFDVAQTAVARWNESQSSSSTGNQDG